MLSLPDVNVLVALAWPNHVHHQRAHEWFRSRADNWATTPLTESGLIRVSSNSRVIPEAVSVATAADLLRAMTSLAGHTFLADSFSWGSGPVDPRVVQGYRMVTDAHLVGIARQHDATVVTFDRGVESLARTMNAPVALLSL